MTRVVLNAKAYRIFEIIRRLGDRSCEDDSSGLIRSRTKGTHVAANPVLR